MDESYSESDVSMSPSQILERLQALRHLQLLQRGKLQKQRLEYQETSEASSSITEIVSHFSNSISYNTFRSLLQAPSDSSSNVSPRLNTSNVSEKIKERDLVEGVSVLNLSQESEFIVNSPTSTKSRVSVPSRTETSNSPVNKSSDSKIMLKKQISLDDMPILSPKKDFESLLIEKLQKEKSSHKAENSKNSIPKVRAKKPFLKRGEGMARFGLNKKDLIIQNTKSLPWKQCHPNTLNNSIQRNTEASKVENKSGEKEVPVQILVNDQKQSMDSPPFKTKIAMKIKDIKMNLEKGVENQNFHAPNKACEQKQSLSNSEDLNTCNKQMQLPSKPVKFAKPKHPLIQNKGKTWAAVLTNEQNDFLRELKQSDYYKNFASPAKSTVSDVSYDDNLSQLQQDREKAEQNMFELLENKVCHESFNLENSFFNRFLRKSKLECSGESTPLVLQKCLASNPKLLHIFPDVHHERNHNTQSDAGTCNSEYTECCSDACSSVSSCCSCKTVEPMNTKHVEENKKIIPKENRKKVETSNKEKETDNDTDIMKANMVEMNAKLIKTSELLKDRLHELEDEIETFRKENANLTKLREEIDLERQKFYEEKSSFEQKFNEEKILSEYYLAEEKEKLTKQKQMYDRYVREMRGRLNKKDKDEVLNLKKEINDLKEEIRIKDAKSTSSIARLRNQLKIMEKEKKNLQSEVEKLKKENRRIQHSNEVTRRLTNIKYLEQINKKLSHMTAKDTQSEVNLDSDVKYKAFEIERQSRSRRAVPSTNSTIRPRAKSVPNLNVTSRYAKYFSQRDAVSQAEKNKTVNVEQFGTYTYPSDNEDTESEEEPLNLDNSGSLQDNNMSDSENENKLEKLYMERFKSTSPKSNRSSLSNSKSDCNVSESFDHTKKDPFFIQKSNSSRDSKSPIPQSTSPYNLIYSGISNITRSKSPVSILSRRSSGQRSPVNMNMGLYNLSEKVSSNMTVSNNRSKSPLSSMGNFSSNSQKPTVVANAQYREKLMTVSPEPTTSKTSLTKTNWNPTEIQKPDGSRELRFPNGNIKYISADGRYSKFLYYNGDVKENFYGEGRIKYFYSETKTFHTTHADGLEVLEFPDGQVEKRYKDGSTEIRLPNGSVRYFDPKNEHVREEWRFPDGAALTVAASGEQRIVFANGQVEVHAKDHKRREFPDGTVKLVYNDGTSETRYASGRVRIKDKHGNLIMDSAPG